jgi:hypothetical protein
MDMSCQSLNDMREAYPVLQSFETFDATDATATAAGRESCMVRIILRICTTCILSFLRPVRFPTIPAVVHNFICILPRVDRS